MGNYRIRWKNFHGFEDTGDIEIRPVTIFIGANNSGKSSLFLPLRIMQQTMEAEDHAEPTLISRGSEVNAGSFRDLVYDGNLNGNVGFDLVFDSGDIEDDHECSSPFHCEPGKLSVKFCHSEQSGLARLHEMKVYNTRNQYMFSRRLKANGSYSIEGMNYSSGQAQSDFHRRLRSEFRKSSPRGFLFRSHDAVIPAIRELPFESPRDIGHPVSSYWQSIDSLYYSLVYFFKRLSYLGPLREPPHRVYQISGSAPESVGSSGSLAPEILYHASEQQREEIQSWLERFNFLEKLGTNDLGEGAFSIYMRSRNSAHKINYVDMGFGLSQVLPLIVESVVCNPKSLLISEQPEIHLNPKLQMVLAELFAMRANQKGFTIIETHSEHILLRLRRMVAENRLEAAKIALYYVERRDGQSAVRQVPIEENGHIEDQSWPSEFFGDTLDESIKLALAQID